MAKDFVRNSR